MIHERRIDSVQDFSQPSSLRGKANNNPSSRACFDSECAQRGGAVHRPVNVLRERERAGQGGAEQINALCTALQ